MVIKKPSFGSEAHATAIVPQACAAAPHGVREKLFHPPTKPVVELYIIHTFSSSQPQVERFSHGAVLVEGLQQLSRVAFLAQVFVVQLQISRDRPALTPAISAEGMCSGADPQAGLTPPITQIMSAFMPRTRVVGNFVMCEARFG